MKAKIALLLLAMLASAPTTAQTVEPTFKADPDVYKVIFEDASFRVIVGTRAKGVKDKPHNHPLPGIVYNVNDCKNKIYGLDGQSRLADNKRGTANATPVGAHQTENIGDTECVQVFVEKK